MISYQELGFVVPSNFLNVLNKVEDKFMREL